MHKRTGYIVTILVGLLVSFALIKIAGTPAAMNLASPPVKGVSTEARETIAFSTLVLVAAALILAMLLIQRAKNQVRKLVVGTSVVMVLLGATGGLMALASVGF